ncbi:MAG: hypothetical protein WCO45_06710 [Pseudanabaena sp. ELA607]
MTPLVAAKPKTVPFNNRHCDVINVSEDVSQLLSSCHDHRKEILISVELISCCAKLPA